MSHHSKNLEQILVIIPARGGSKGIPKKNIYPVNNKPLIEYTIDFAKSLFFNTNILVSTDSIEIAEISKSLGVSCPFLRPEFLSTDFIGDMPVLRHAYLEYKKISKQDFEIVIMLQPTSPIRFEKPLNKAILELRDRNLDSVISVSEVPNMFHPLKQFEISENRLKTFSKDSKKVVARQQLNKSYIRNGVFYVFNSNFLLESEFVFSDNTGFILIDQPFVNIDSMEDIDTFKNFLGSE